MDHTIEERLKLFEHFSVSYSNCQYGPEKIEYMSTFYHQALLLAAVCKHRSVRRHVFALANTVLKHANLLISCTSVASNFYPKNFKFKKTGAYPKNAIISPISIIKSHILLSLEKTHIITDSIKKPVPI